MNVRRALAAEPDLPVEVAELLATDFDATVSHTARRHLTNTSPDPHPHRSQPPTTADRSFYPDGWPEL